MAPAELRGAPRRHTVVAGSDARTSLLRHRRFRAKARLALRARNANPFWRGLRPTGGGGENRTRVRSSVPQDLYERSPGFDLTLASPMRPDPPEPVAVKSPPGGRDAR